MPLVKYGFHYADFQETHIHLINCYGHPLCQIVFKSEEKVEYRQDIIYTFK
jgi:hypothetical protein